jgi:ankyrin repeat protein
MMRLLISHGANINAPAHPDGGRTPLQAALEGQNPISAAKILLSHGVDASAHPAKRRGLTALEALCHNRCKEIREGSGGQQLCHELLDAGAMVNRPRRRPSSALHGVIEKGWHEILARFLELEAITTHIWCRADDDNSDNASDDDIDGGNDVEMDDSEDDYSDDDSDDDYSDDDSDDDDDNREHDISDLIPFFPTQLAASRGDLKALTMLLKHGTDANEPPASDSGRTALQAACLLKPGPEKTAVIDLLLQHGADIHAAPAARRGVTALQAAAISGDFVLAEYFLSCGADVNEAPSGYEGRTAIEGAAEHGRLDMVQLLLNAGAKGDPDRWVRLAGANGHVAVCSLLKEQRQEDS